MPTFACPGAPTPPPACLQPRRVLVPSSLLADLKRRANQELEQQQQQQQEQEQGGGAQEVAQMYGEQVAGSRVEVEGPGGGAQRQQAGQAQGALRASAGVRWVSTNDALVARAMQVGVHGCMQVPCGHALQVLRGHGCAP